MRRAAIATLIASLVVCSAAQARDGHHPKRPISRDAALQRSIDAAKRFWAGWTPRCGQPAVAVVKLDRPISGQAEFDPCQIDLQAALVANAPKYPGGFYNLCQTVVHEWGHEVLGPDYFAGSNPSDPGHSPDRDSVMAARPVATTPQCLAALNAAYFDVGRQVWRARVKLDGPRCRVFLGQLRVKALARCVNATPAQTLM